MRLHDEIRRMPKMLLSLSGILAVFSILTVIFYALYIDCDIPLLCAYMLFTVIIFAIMLFGYRDNAKSVKRAFTVLSVFAVVMAMVYLVRYIIIDYKPFFKYNIIAYYGSIIVEALIVLVFVFFAYLMISSGVDEYLDSFRSNIIAFTFLFLSTLYIIQALFFCIVLQNEPMKLISFVIQDITNIIVITCFVCCVYRVGLPKNEYDRILTKLHNQK